MIIKWEEVYCLFYNCYFRGMFRGMKEIRMFSTSAKSKVAVLLLPGAYNPASNCKEYQMISFMEKENEIILRLGR